jgi:hypothetical protein
MYHSWQSASLGNLPVHCNVPVEELVRQTGFQMNCSRIIAADASRISRSCRRLFQASNALLFQ